MRQAPSLYTLAELRSERLADTTVKMPDGSWAPARPEGYDSLQNRFRLAWLVFKGKADAVTWPGNQ